MRITLLEPYFTGSHAAWAREFALYSRHQVELLTLPGRNWKWRMHGGAVTLASRYLAEERKSDLLLATDMLDLTTFLALTRKATSHCRTAIYFHENQLTYPWSPDDGDPVLRRDLHYAFINYSSALCADAVLFNSSYHKNSFLDALPGFLKGFPDYDEADSARQVADRSRVLPLGLDLRKLDQHRPQPLAVSKAPLILWNHRWEYDKAPEQFFEALYQLAGEGVEFRLAVLGESFRKAPPVFLQARERLSSRIVGWGYQESFADYAGWLWQADLLPVTSRQEFFGASVVQALYCGCAALLPERLAYPEHVPCGKAAEVLYQQEEQLVDRLRGILTGELQVPQLHGHVARYDWQNMAPLYDDFFERLAAGDGQVPPGPTL
ncbi:MAG TPA: DUF3524 domain-containing protein [Geomonas sp.]|nr:DUF3524 domain-containing protein [Geomonas sp.]